MAKQKTERITTSPISEYYIDLLKVDAWLAAKTKSSQATTLLCEGLLAREETIKERIQYIAEKRGIKVNQLWAEILEDKAGEPEKE